jgi:hypothetical protein
MLIFAADPVVTSTNQGRARNVICEPSEEIPSAVSRAIRGRRRADRSPLT